MLILATETIAIIYHQEKIPTAAHETLNFVTVVFIVATYRFDEGHRKQLPGFSESVRPPSVVAERTFL